MKYLLLPALLLLCACKTMVPELQRINVPEELMKTPEDLETINNG